MKNYIELFEYYFNISQDFEETWIKYETLFESVFDLDKNMPRSIYYFWAGALLQSKKSLNSKIMQLNRGSRYEYTIFYNIVCCLFELDKDVAIEIYLEEQKLSLQRAKLCHQLMKKRNIDLIEAINTSLSGRSALEHDRKYSIQSSAKFAPKDSIYMINTKSIILTLSEWNKTLLRYKDSLHFIPNDWKQQFSVEALNLMQTLIDLVQERSSTNNGTT